MAVKVNLTAVEHNNKPYNIKPKATVIPTHYHMTSVVYRFLVIVIVLCDGIIDWLQMVYF
jgi:hypothetical protein